MRMTPDEMERFYNLEYMDEYKVNYNVAPTHSVPAIRMDAARNLVANNLHWPFVPPWAKDPKKVGYDTYNAKGEEAASKPMYRKAFRTQRCIVPASGYYEWKKITPKEKQPYYFTLRSGEPLAMAGLWETWGDKATGKTLESFTIVTTEANELIAEIHDKKRMPVLIPREAWSIWLDPTLQEPEVPQSMIVNTPSEMWQRWPVSKAVGNPRNNYPDLIKPIVLEETPISLDKTPISVNKTLF